MAVQIVWFKRDLRVEDHRPLAEAAAAQTTHGPVAPLYVVEPDWWAEPDMSARHWAFVTESLQSLREALAQAGQPLIVRVGEVVSVLADLHERHGVSALWSHEETGAAWTYDRDKRIAAWARSAGVAWREIPQSGVIRRLANRDGWAKRWDRLMAEPVTSAPALTPLDPDAFHLGDIPAAQQLGLAPDPCLLRQPGGRAAALSCLDSFLHERGQPYRRAMSSPVTGFEACSRLSPHLAWGVLSMRETAQASWARQRALKARAATAPSPDITQWRGAMSSFVGRLHWRDHFTQKLEDEPAMEVRDLHPAYRGMRPGEPDAEKLAAWCAGETGLPFVDACMRALQATGWMNFRMRAMLMAVSSYHLWLPWRRPGEHLARLFTDYEPGIHWPQTQMQSGVTGINTVRIYNPVKQGRDQDPEGVFVRHWVPELSDVPDKYLHEPWRWEEAGTVLGHGYPFPIVDHLEAAKEARQKIWAVRRGAAYRDEADRIQSKHGSRKSGIPHTGQKPRRAGARAPRRPAKTSAAEAQIGLPLSDES